MPLYEYICKKCGHVFDFLACGCVVDANVKCPWCQEANPKRICSTLSSDNPADVNPFYVESSG
ncbi:MAG: hypothetical protein JW954_05885 [Dehalococcoidaceae bacterium]|nr:hypothetical protein [Dehalococcoidaceae bacterium]